MADVFKKPAKAAETQTKTDLENFLSPTVAEVEEATDGFVATYSSHPIVNYRLGRRWKFQNGTLKITDPEEAKEFEASLAKLPPIEQTKIKRVDVQAAEKISREFLSKQGGATQQIDSTIGDRATQPKLGKTDINDPNANGGAVS